MNNAVPLPNGPKDWIEDFANDDNGCYQHHCKTCHGIFFGAKSRRLLAICKTCDDRQRLYGIEAFAELENDNAALVAAGMEIPDENYRDAFVNGYVRASIAKRSKDPEGQRAALGWMRAQAKLLDPSIVPDELTTSDLARIICEKMEHPKVNEQEIRETLMMFDTATAQAKLLILRDKPEGWQIPLGCIDDADRCRLQLLAKMKH